MALRIETFSNVKGGNSFYKALSHPLTAERARRFIDAVAASGAVAVYDPQNFLEGMTEFYDLSEWDVRHVFVQRIESLGQRRLGRQVQPVTELPDCRIKTLFVACFDAKRLLDQVRHLIPEGVSVVTLDDIRLPDEMLTNTRQYLNPLNFATNFAFFRDAGGQHTTVASCNYWHGYGAADVAVWLCLFDEDGKVLAQWQQRLPAAAAGFRIDSREVRSRFDLPAFTGSLFMHVQRIAGHDTVKYALDTYGDNPSELSCTHDANAWPADYYAGLPAPQQGEQVILWIQNSNPIPIPAGAVGLSRMGSAEVKTIDREIPPFGTHAVDTATLFPEDAWPAQHEVHAGRYFVRPRYEVVKRGGPRRIAHANVERTDLAPDARLPQIQSLVGKGYILPAPVLPPDRWSSTVMPTPMARDQQELPLALAVYDAGGEEVARRSLGRLPRGESIAVEVDAVLTAAKRDLPGGYGHMELLYDYHAGHHADGWLHGLFHYRHKATGHGADTSFGAHMYNMPLTYRDEPQSYINIPPGLSTRLFLRLGPAPLDTFCHLIYPASRPWHPHSATRLILHDGAGAEVATREVAIPCSGSLLWYCSDMFDAADRERAGDGAYVLIRDVTCRLFGYHGLVRSEGVFSLDHMFGF
jgi:hypothetical protein